MIEILLFVTAIFIGGDYIGQSYVTVDPVECAAAVENARSAVPEGMYVADCTPVILRVQE